LNNQIHCTIIDERLDEKDKTYWIASVKDDNGLNHQPLNWERIHVQERMNRRLREKRNVVPVYKMSEK
jgi:hypothetical protein